MASILTVANIHFDTTGTNRLEYLNSDNVIRVQARAVKLGLGPTTERPPNEQGLIRYNSDSGIIEYYSAVGWANVASNTNLSALESSITSSISGTNTYLQGIVTSTNNFTKATIAGANVAVGNGANSYTDTANTFLRNLISTATVGANNWSNTKLSNSTVTLAGTLTVTGTVADSNGSFRIIPASSTSGTLVKGDVGKYIPITAGITVPSGVFSSGDAISIYNNSGSSQTITATGVTMYLAGTATTGNRTIAQRGVATILCVGSDTFVITGSGLS